MYSVFLLFLYSLMSEWNDFEADPIQNYLIVKEIEKDLQSILKRVHSKAYHQMEAKCIAHKLDDHIIREKAQELVSKICERWKVIVGYDK